MTDEEAWELLPQAVEFVKAVDARDELAMRQILDEVGAEVMAVLCAGLVTELRDHAREHDRARREGIREARLQHGELWQVASRATAQLRESERRVSELRALLDNAVTHHSRREALSG